MMDCNREEAFRARDIAVKKMESNDFAGAKRIALEAQKLFPDLENVSQLLSVCNVHCAAEVRVEGDKDWYGILQVEEAADEAMIRKQYRKLAFSLHPDKNSFAGAEAAFKLVLDAHSVLSDSAKRFQYDIKRKNRSGNLPTQSKQQPSKRTDADIGTMPKSEETFWTMCSYCQMCYEYYSYVLNNTVLCRNCNKNFFAYQFKEQPMPTSSNVPNGSQPNIFPNKQRDTPSQQGHPVKPSCGSRDTDAKRNGSQAPAKMFPNQQHGIPPQQGHSLKPSAAEHTDNTRGYSSAAGEKKANRSEMIREGVEISMKNKNTGGISMPDPVDLNIIDRRKLGREDASTEPSAAGSSGPCKPGRRKQHADGKSQVPAKMFPNQQRGIPPQLGRSWKSTSAKYSDNTRGYSSPTGEKKANRSEMIREGVEISMKNKNAGGRSMPDPVDLNIIDRRKFGREATSTEPSAAGSSGPRRPGRSKQDADGKVCLTSGSKKRQRKNDSPCKKWQRKQIFAGNVTSSNRQSDPLHVSSKVDVQEKAKATDQGDIKGEATETADEKIPRVSRSFSFPDPDFFDFAKFRDVNLFAVGQIWALYDEIDGMPRYYGQIERFDASNFEVRWLEYHAMNEEEEKWNDVELPIACGNYCIRKAKDAYQDRSMFSHVVEWTKGKKRNSYVIYPNKGEVWALYKGWSMEWSSVPDNHRLYEFEVVQVLSDMSPDNGATVVPLVRINGFVSLFATAKDKSSFVIPSSELLRFSHRIPVYRTKGNEKVGVPSGLIELDNACLPGDLDAAFSSVTLDSYMALGKKISSTSVDMAADNTRSRTDSEDEQIAQKEYHSEGHDFHPKSTDNNHKDISSEQNTPSQNRADDANGISPYVYAYPDPEFHSFDEDRSCEKFERGQIWAIYSDIDKFPKFYGLITKVEPKPFRVHLNWLHLCAQHRQEIRWLEQEIPVSCGIFEVLGGTEEYDTNEIFSHLVDARQMGTKWQVDPQVGEVWAIYMNWAPDWVPSSADACEFAVCDILECTEASTKVTFLAQVSGYVSVFRPDELKGSLEVPTEQKLRFSHRVPCFRLTGERDSRLWGCCELDPGSVPNVVTKVFIPAQGHLTQQHADIQADSKIVT